MTVAEAKADLLKEYKRQDKAKREYVVEYAEAANAKCRIIETILKLAAYDGAAELQTMKSAIDKVVQRL